MRKRIKINKNKRDKENRKNNKNKCDKENRKIRIRINMTRRIEK